MLINVGLNANKTGLNAKQDTLNFNKIFMNFAFGANKIVWILINLVSMLKTNVGLNANCMNSNEHA